MMPRRDRARRRRRPRTAIIAGALAELASLPRGGARARAGVDQARPQAQIAALAAARRLADDAVGALGKAAP